MAGQFAKPRSDPFVAKPRSMVTISMRNLEFQILKDWLGHISNL